MSKLEFGWRMATFSMDGSPAATLVGRAEKAASGNKYLAPDDVAEAVVFLLRQSPRAWTQELQLWPFT